MDDLGLQRFCDCADGAGIDVRYVRSRVLELRKSLFEMNKTQTTHEVDHTRKAIIATIADMSFGLERFAGKSASAIAGATYILSAVLPRMPALGKLARESLSLTSSLFDYFNANEDNTLIRVLTDIFHEFFNATQDTYIHEHRKTTRDLIVQKKYFISGIESKAITDAEISVICQVIPTFIQMPVFRVLEIRIADQFAELKWTYPELYHLLMYLKLYCQLISLKLVLMCNAFDVFHLNMSCVNIAGGYSAAIQEQLRTCKLQLAPLMEEKHHMVLAHVGPMNWPDIYSFLPLIDIKCNNCADWLMNYPVYPPGAILAGKMKNGSESFIGRIETVTEVLIGQIYGLSIQWIGNLSEYIPKTDESDVESEKATPTPKEPDIKTLTDRVLAIKKKMREDEHGPDKKEDESDDNGEEENDDDDDKGEETDRAKESETEEEKEIKSAEKAKREREKELLVDEGEGEEYANNDEVEEEDPNVPADVRMSTDVNEYQILCVTDPRLKVTWRPNVTGVPQSVGALRAGVDLNGTPYFIGRMFVNEEPVIGPVCGPFFFYVSEGNIIHENDEMKYEVLCLENL